MPDLRDRTLIEEARTQRMRLGSALLYGRVDERRSVNDNLRRLVGSLVVAALACAVCVGISFVSDLLATQAAEKAASGMVATTGTDAEADGGDDGSGARP
ncbi:hypothetical protein [Microbacterium sp. 179-I 3D4 NHS]|uniref:hypothetical protein n=1 Tax=Microbacterium sp. 179-I 3D4 NHS TaxID=3142381 RepID=UPI0039A13B81